jgi:hypothetical protein
MGAHQSRTAPQAVHTAYVAPQQTTTWTDATKSSRPHQNGVHQPYSNPGVGAQCASGQTKNVDSACIAGVNGETSKAYKDVCNQSGKPAYAALLQQDIGTNTMSATAIRLARERRPKFSAASKGL